MVYAENLADMIEAMMYGCAGMGANATFTVEIGKGRVLVGQFHKYMASLHVFINGRDLFSYKIEHPDLASDVVEEVLELWGNDE